jgi:hypothetical protein
LNARLVLLSSFDSVWANSVVSLSQTSVACSVSIVRAADDDADPGLRSMPTPLELHAG